MIDIPDFVYPKDSEGQPVCPRCQKRINACDCPSGEKPKPKAPKVNPHIRLEKSGRNGKTVTVISNLPTSEKYLKETSKTLKSKTGSGGTYYVKEGMGVIEIQGDHQTQMLTFFNSKA